VSGDVRPVPLPVAQNAGTRGSALATRGSAKV
jgi:hypothetical protein